MTYDPATGRNRATGTVFDVGLTSYYEQRARELYPKPMDARLERYRHDRSVVRRRRRRAIALRLEAHGWAAAAAAALASLVLPWQRVRSENTGRILGEVETGADVLGPAASLAVVAIVAWVARSLIVDARARAERSDDRLRRHTKGPLLAAVAGAIAALGLRGPAEQLHVELLGGRDVALAAALAAMPLALCTFWSSRWKPGPAPEAPAPVDLEPDQADLIAPLRTALTGIGLASLWLPWWRSPVETLVAGERRVVDESLLLLRAAWTGAELVGPAALRFLVVLAGAAAVLPIVATLRGPGGRRWRDVCDVAGRLATTGTGVALLAAVVVTTIDRRAAPTPETALAVVLGLALVAVPLAARRRGAFLALAPAVVLVAVVGMIAWVPTTERPASRTGELYAVAAELDTVGPTSRTGEPGPLVAHPSALTTFGGEWALLASSGRRVITADPEGRALVLADATTSIAAGGPDDILLRFRSSFDLRRVGGDDTEVHVPRRDDISRSGADGRLIIADREKPEGQARMLDPGALAELADGVWWFEDLPSIVVDPNVHIDRIVPDGDGYVRVASGALVRGDGRGSETVIAGGAARSCGLTAQASASWVRFHEWFLNPFVSDGAGGWWIAAMSETGSNVYVIVHVDTSGTMRRLPGTSPGPVDAMVVENDGDLVLTAGHTRPGVFVVNDPTTHLELLPAPDARCAP
ncbi:MAG: hypothetical protein S0880_27705 [Actinomycetota bacterium]|nr:hypothetical protein [Actinomycetota bacterium]